MGGRPAALSYSNTAGRHSGRHVRPAIVGRAETGFHARSPGSPPRLAARLALFIDARRVASGCVGNAARFGHRSGGLCAVRPDASEPFSSSIVVAPSPAALFQAAILDADGTASSARRSPPKAGPAGSTRCAGSVQRRRLHDAVAARRGGPRRYGAALGQLAGGSVRGPNASRRGPRGQQGSNAHRAAQESQYASECGHRPGRLDQLRGACRVGVNQHLVINVSNEPVANIFP